MGLPPSSCPPPPLDVNSINEGKNKAFLKTTIPRPHVFPAPSLQHTIVLPYVHCGLTNLGNSCYLNSVLQCLTYLPPLYSLARQSYHRKQCARSPCPMCLLEAHIATVATRGRHEPYAPRIFLQHLNTMFSSALVPGQQEDAHEWLCVLLDAAERGCAQGLPKLPPGLHHTTLMHHLFSGHTRGVVQCEACGHESITRDTFVCLSLEIPEGVINLDEALAQFVRPERLDGDNAYQCDTCRQRVAATRRIELDALPPCLVLHLKRFANTHTSGRKITRHVAFPGRIDLRKHLGGGGDGHYQLWGVVVHAGSTPYLGHYMSFVRTLLPAEDGHDAVAAWWEMDDSRVQRVSWNTVCWQPAYLLFYVRMAGDMAPSTVGRTLIGPKSRDGSFVGPKSRDGASSSPGAVNKTKLQAIVPTNLEGIQSQDAPAVSPSAGIVTSPWVPVMPDDDGSCPTAKRARVGTAGCRAGSSHDARKEVKAVLEQHGWVASATSQVQKLLQADGDKDEEAFVARVRSTLLPRLQQEAVTLWERHSREHEPD